MAIFTSVFTKHGNVWPKDYLATLPDGTTKKFRLKRNKIILLAKQQKLTDDERKEFNEIMKRIEGYGSVRYRLPKTSKSSVHTVPNRIG